MDAVIWAHALSTTLMTGVIWFVQIVHYPLFARVGADAFAAYEQAHQTRTTIVVGPLMLIEAATAGVILISRLGDPLTESYAAWCGFGLVVVIWASTALVQVPLHRRLQAGYDVRAGRLLVTTNFVRTVAWSVRTIIAFSMLSG